MMAIKRTREDQILDFKTSLAMANYLILLSQSPGPEARSRVYECKTCNKKFPSFQALGGHRASHKRPKLEPGHAMMITTNHDDDDDDQIMAGKKHSKAHECSVCGLEFAIGQALGGHMRRHRTALTGSQPHDLTLSLGTSSVLGQESCVMSKGRNSGDDHDHDRDDHGNRVKWLDLTLSI